MKPENLKKIPNRQIAIKANVDQRTVASFFAGKEIQYNKRLQIMNAIDVMLQNQSTKQV